MPILPTITSDLKWVIDHFFFRLFIEKPVKLFLPGLAGFCLIICSILVFRDLKEKLFLLILPIIICLFASGLHKYPFKGRVLLFIAPLLILLVAEGTWYFLRKLGNKEPLIAVIFLITLLFQPTIYQLYKISDPNSGQEIRLALNKLKERKEKQNMLYVYYGANSPRTKRTRICYDYNNHQYCLFN